MTIQMKECCVEGYPQARMASQRGADRVELCENLAVGGTTPSYGAVKLAVDRLPAKVAVMIRPRDGSFVYTEDEFDCMREDLIALKPLKPDAFVFGFLKEDDTVNEERIREFVDLAHPIPVTFHMAFNRVPDQRAAIDLLADMGVKRILTSGRDGKAPDQLDHLKELVDYAGDRIVVMPGAGITADNLQGIHAILGAREYHGTKIV
jgi:copper homeostasis protein